MYDWTVIVTPQKTLYKVEVLIDQTFPRYNTLHPKGQHKVLLLFRKHTTIFYLTAFMKNLAIIKIITNDTSDSLLRSLLYLVLFILSTPVRSQDLVGTIDGAFSVSPTGAATYTIPIDLRPGYGAKPYRRLSKCLSGEIL